MLDPSDYRMLREEGQDTRRKLDILHDDLIETNRLLREILIELVKQNAME